VIKFSDDCERHIAQASEKAISIEQRYLGNDRGLSVRVRKSAIEGYDSYRMTVKQNVAGETVEIETIISKDDFTKLWSVASRSVEKTRYIYLGWEIDFFKNSGRNYFAVAEIEMPRGQKAPDSIPPLISQYIIYNVKQGDGGFSNKLLGNVKHAQNLLKKIGKVSEVGHPIEEACLYKQFKNASQQKRR
jgi:CYTH domain-containing protein